MGLGLDAGRGGARPGAGRKPREVEAKETANLLCNLKKLEGITGHAIDRLTELVKDPTLAPKTALEVVKVIIARTVPVATCVKAYEQHGRQQQAPKIIGVKDRKSVV